MATFREELTNLINRHSIENGSDTPDFILSRYLCDCLENFNSITKRRKQWHCEHVFDAMAGRPLDVLVKSLILVAQ